MKPNNTKTEALVKLAIRAGCVCDADIAYETGLSFDSVKFALCLLEIEHEVKGIPALRAILSPTAPPAKQPQYITHNSVILDPSLEPHIAADLIRQVLGVAYGAQLLEALVQA